MDKNKVFEIRCKKCNKLMMEWTTKYQQKGGCVIWQEKAEKM